VTVNRHIPSQTDRGGDPGDGGSLRQKLGVVAPSRFPLEWRELTALAEMVVLGPQRTSPSARMVESDPVNSSGNSRGRRLK
jgi:hypothetical protein